MNNMRLSFSEKSEQKVLEIFGEIMYRCQEPAHLSPSENFGYICVFPEFWFWDQGRFCSPGDA